MSSQIRVRYAPSPTGHLHIGGARTALFNYLFAKRHGGKFIIRIEDTDQKRHVEDAETSQLDNLKWLGITWDESVDIGGEYGPYRCTDRLHIYKPYAEQLIEKGYAYRCFCTEEELEAEREEQRARGETPQYSGKCRHLTHDQIEERLQQGVPYTIRFHVPKGREIVVEDLIRGTVRFDTDGIGDFVIVKRDGIPTYNFAVTVDDALMKITHVIRGEEHLTNTPRQMLIYEALGFEMPRFGHLPLILNQDRQKMSKRDESIVQFIEQYRELGYLPEGIINFIALLGWSPEGEEEIFYLEQLEELFDIERVQKSPAVFDTDKLAYMNNVHMKQASVERIVPLCIPHLQRAGYIPEKIDDSLYEWLTRLVSLYKDQMHYAAEIVEKAALFFNHHVEYDDEAKEILSGEQVPAVLKSFQQKIEGSSEYSPELIKAWLKEVQKETGAKGKLLFMPVRVVVTGQSHGPDLEHTLYLLGKDTVLRRIQNYLA